MSQSQENVQTEGWKDEQIPIDRTLLTTAGGPTSTTAVDHI